ncbi:MAG TPA: SurA N-terminal domain-containing protein [Hyphomicrobiaceae bacterium]|nr:SurA N-terminal domain-containing protein [Hyphomicrobiaceae bacterium]
MNGDVLRAIGRFLVGLGTGGLLLALCPAALAQAPQSLPGLIVTVPPPPPAGQPAAPPAKEAAKPAPKAKPKPAEAPPARAASLDTSRESGRQGSGLAIAVIVNGDPITGYQIDQRARLLALSANLGERAQENMQRIVQSERTNERWKEIVQQTIAANQGKTRDQIMAVLEQKKREFGQELQRQAVESARASVMPGLRKTALEELIDERLKLQEAKRVGVTPEETEVENVVKTFAERNKMTPAQFTEHFQKMGINIETLKSRFRAQLGWTDVIRRKFSMQVNITQRDIDQAVASAAGGADQVELQLHRIVIPVPAKLDQKSLAQRFIEAESLRKRYGGCQSTSALASRLESARFENLGTRQAASIAEPTRSLLLNAKDGEMIPPDITADGVELLAVCGRKVTKAQEEQRTKKEAELRQKEFEILARRHLRDLRQDAVIEHR